MMKSTVFLAMALAAMFAVAVPAEAANVKARAETPSWETLKVKADYREKVKHGVTKGQQLRINVKHAFPLQSLDVAVNGELIGTITANIAGRGKLTLKTPHDAVPFIHSGDVLTVGPATATFYTKADKYHVHGHVSADGSSIGGIVKYSQKPHKGILDQRFMVNVEGAGSGEVLDVFVNESLVGSITADENGEGQLKLRTAEFAGDGWEPLPDGFAALHKGDSVSVGGIMVTLH